MTTFARLAAAALLAAAVATGATACRSSEASCSTAHQCLPKVTYEDTNHAKYGPEQLRGKAVVVNFWATWCGPCKKEIPAFNRVYSAYKDKGVVFLGVLHDTTVDDAGLLNFMSDNEFTYPVIPASSTVLGAFHYPNALPTTFVYDAKGRIVTQHKGPMSEQQLSAALDKALAAN